MRSEGGPQPTPMLSLDLFARIQKGLTNPKKVYRLARREIRERFFWNSYYAALREPKVRSAVPCSPAVQEKILAELKDNSFEVLDFKIDVGDFRRWLMAAGYQRFPTYYGGGKGPNFIEKALEHYLAAKFLDLNKEDVYIDIASFDSPGPEIYRSLYGCSVYRQDLSYPEGVTRIS